MNFAKLSQEYLEIARSSHYARLKNEAARYRWTAYGMLRSLEIVTGSLNEALREIEEAYAFGPSVGQAWGYSLHDLLYGMWGIEPPASAVETS